MPSPCSTTATPDPLGLGLATTATTKTGGTSETVPGIASEKTFDNVLSQLDPAAQNGADPQADSDADTAATSDKTATAAPLSAEQLALLAQYVVPPAPVTPAAPEVSVPTTGMEEGACSLELLTGNNNRSLPELLASGVETLEYAVGPRATDPAAGMPAVPGMTAGSPVETTPTLGNESPAVFASTAATQKPTEAGTPLTTATAAVVPVESQDVPGRLPVKGVPDLPVKGPVASPSPHSVPGVQSAPADSAASTPALAAQAPTATTPVQMTTVAQVTQAAGAESATAAANVAGTLGTTGRSGAVTSRRFATEKIAGPQASHGLSGGLTPGVVGKKMNLVSEDQQLTEAPNAVGTTAAKWGKTMFHDARSLAASALQPDTPAIAGGISIGNGHTTSASTPQVAAAEPNSHAAELVHEIRDIADGLWAVERNSVEVKFNFGSSERLSVRVEYKEGTVHAIFRTDSPDLRDAIAREWQVQSSANEQRPYRVADPVFSSSGFSTGGDASRQQRSAEQAQTFERAAHFGGSRNQTSVPTSSPAASALHRPERAGHLHALV